MRHFEVKQVYPWLYSIKELDVFCYLIVGRDKALLFDAAYGIYDLREVVEKIIDKPYTVVLGHGHIDHINAAPQFDFVMINKADIDLYNEHSSVRYRKSIINKARESEYGLPDDYDKDKYANMKQDNLIPLENMMSFKLGSINVDVVDMAGHTAGSIGLLIREFSLLLTSDSANSNCWLFLNESLPLNDYIAMLERVSALPFDKFIIGHSDEPQDKKVFLKYIEIAKNADVSKSEPYAPFEKIPELSGWLYEEDGIRIVFNADKI